MSRALVSFVAFFVVFSSITSAVTLSKQIEEATGYLLENISPPGAAKGAIVAAKSKVDPDYFYHWIRDAGLVMNVVVELYKRAPNAALKQKYEKTILDFIEFTKKNQETANPSGHIGEPKFNADGSAFTGNWGRPQNDGPALRAYALMNLARFWLDKGEIALVKKHLYDGKFPSKSVVKVDLEFVAQRWKETCFDIWEEVKGRHLYTRLAQWRSLVQGAELADRLEDGGAAEYYRKEAAALEKELGRHWDATKGHLIPTVDRDGGIGYKNSVDASTILAALHLDLVHEPFGLLDDRFQATFSKSLAVFEQIYTINKQGLPAAAIGRYPEDQYDGVHTGKRGNPWVLITFGYGEVLFKMAAALESEGVARVTDLSREFFKRFGVTTKGDLKDAALTNLVDKMRVSAMAYLERARYHAKSGGHYSEQIDRETGMMRGAEDLTWSYAAALTAAWSAPQ